MGREVEEEKVFESKCLDLFDKEKMKLSEFKSRLQNNPNVTELSFFGCYQSTDEWLLVATKKLQNLISLDVRTCKLTDKSLGYISKYCLKLECLDMGGCRRATLLGVLKVIKRCKRLKRLNLTACRLKEYEILNVIRGCEKSNRKVTRRGALLNIVPNIVKPSPVKLQGCCLQ